MEDSTVQEAALNLSKNMFPLELHQNISNDRGIHGENPGDQPQNTLTEMIIGDANVFTVDKIFKKRVRKGRIQYLVKWLGYPHSMNTWEPEENFYFPEAIQEFEKVEAEKKERRSRIRQNKRLRRSKVRFNIPIRNNQADSEISSEAMSVGGDTPPGACTPQPPGVPETSQESYFDTASSTSMALVHEETTGSDKYDMSNFVESCEGLSSDLMVLQREALKRTATESDICEYPCSPVAAKRLKLLNPGLEDAIQEENEFTEEYNRLNSFIDALVGDFTLNESEDEDDYVWESYIDLKPSLPDMDSHQFM